jgi:hypothetical protein
LLLFQEVAFFVLSAVHQGRAILLFVQIVDYLLWNSRCQLVELVIFVSSVFPLSGGNAWFLLIMQVTDSSAD